MRIIEAGSGTAEGTIAMQNECTCEEPDGSLQAQFPGGGLVRYRSRTSTASLPWGVCPGEKRRARRTASAGALRMKNEEAQGPTTRKGRPRALRSRERGEIAEEKAATGGRRGRLGDQRVRQVKPRSLYSRMMRLMKNPKCIKRFKGSILSLRM